MTSVARKCIAELDSLPPAEHKVASMRTAAFSSVAQQRLSGAPMPALPFNFMTPSPPPRVPSHP